MKKKKKNSQRIKFIRIYGNYEYAYFSERSVVDLYLKDTYMT